jgi:hypothetical protein
MFSTTEAEVNHEPTVIRLFDGLHFVEVVLHFVLQRLNLLRVVGRSFKHGLASKLTFT